MVLLFLQPRLLFGRVLPMSHIIILHLRSQLSREKKGDASASSYYAKMKGLADEMGAAGKKLEDEDIIGYIL
ncbi:hypothetical protein U9M48_040124 [Paspalum notatum var. saurae]|uniref:Uncharacterized protein n=1 Tax=Paspalum notatum var. saurae TaxID=547442 RepID=A0AAQ3UKC9_PASNO